MTDLKSDQLTIAIAQVSPVWLNRKATINKLINFIEKAAKSSAKLVVFGEAILPGYPFWLAYTDGARFEDETQKALHAHYLNESVNIKDGDLNLICEACKVNTISAIVGIVERAADRGGHSLFCSLVYISKTGAIENVHRKLVPTYEERLCWAQGDGNGLRVFPVGKFLMGALNCWENWMPMARTALHNQGEDVHIALWPGNLRNTEDITKFMAKESRSYVISVSGLLAKKDISDDLPFASLLQEKIPDGIADGGSCVAAPDGSWLLEPQLRIEDIFIVQLDHKKVREERQNFDYSGHYSRPDVFSLEVDQRRQTLISFRNGEGG